MKIRKSVFVAVSFLLAGVWQEHAYAGFEFLIYKSSGKVFDVKLREDIPLHKGYLAVYIDVDKEAAREEYRASVKSLPLFINEQVEKLRLRCFAEDWSFDEQAERKKLVEQRVKDLKATLTSKLNWVTKLGKVIEFEIREDSPYLQAIQEGVGSDVSTPKFKDHLSKLQTYFLTEGARLQKMIPSETNKSIPVVVKVDPIPAPGAKYNPSLGHITFELPGKRKVRVRLKGPGVEVIETLTEKIVVEDSMESIEIQYQRLGGTFVIIFPSSVDEQIHMLSSFDESNIGTYEDVETVDTAIDAQSIRQLVIHFLYDSLTGKLTCNLEPQYL